MKRYVCTVAAGLLLALAGSGTASATGLPILGGIQEATQSVSFGDQTVGEQKNDADVTQKQGNGNVNIAPAIAIFGDAETTNKQGNGNTRNGGGRPGERGRPVAVVVPASVARAERRTRKGRLLRRSEPDRRAARLRRRPDRRQAAETTPMSASTRATATSNIAPAIAIFGDAETTNYQGNGNTADASVDAVERRDPVTVVEAEAAPVPGRERLLRAEVRRQAEARW